MRLLPVEQFEEIVVEVAKIIRQEREQGRLSSGVTIDNKLVRLPKRGRAIFVGDIHGELESVDEILLRTNFAEENANPERKDYIIFLGDLVDRGPSSVEVLTKLLALKTRFGENVVLLRGNHETPDVNSRYGFIDEVSRKYPREANEVYSLCNRLFEKFPHAVFTENGIFAAHGGVPENVFTLSQIADLNGVELEQLLWNDPRPDIHGFEQNYERDPMGSSPIRYFGEDVTKEFLKGVGARILVRAHEYFDGSGYKVVSSNILTIFSSKYGRPDWTRAYLDTSLSKELRDVNSLVTDIRAF